MTQFHRNFLLNINCLVTKSECYTENEKTEEFTMSGTKVRGLHLHRVKRIWYLSPMRAAKVQASLRIRAVSPEPSLLAHTSSESRGTFRQKARSLAPLNGWACAVEICHDGMLEDTNSLDGAHLKLFFLFSDFRVIRLNVSVMSNESFGIYNKTN